MNDTAQTLIRSVLKVGGGYLVSKGITSDTTWEIVIAGTMAVVGIVWGVLHRTPQPPAK